MVEFISDPANRMTVVVVLLGVYLIYKLVKFAK